MKKLELTKSKIFSFSNNLNKIENEAPFLSNEMLEKQLNIWRFQDKKIVFTNGCFDLLHLGHIDYLSKAADLGDILILGVNSDNSVKQIKGETRPITNQLSRIMLLASLFFVNAVVLFEESTPIELIKFIQPDILVKGSDYEIKNIVGNHIVTAKGGVIITIEYLEGFSTTLIEKKIIEKYLKSIKLK